MAQEVYVIGFQIEGPLLSCSFSYGTSLSTMPSPSTAICAALRYNELRWPNTNQAGQRTLIRHPHQLPKHGSRRSWHDTRSALIQWTSSKHSSPTSAKSP